MKRILSILLLAFALFGCERQSPVGLEISREAAGISGALLSAYESGSVDALREVLEKWQAENQPQKLESIEDPVIRDIHEIYKVFFTPFDLGRIGDSEWGDGIYSEVDYLIVQNQLFYDHSLGTTIFDQLELDTLTDFRPELSSEKAGVLYLTSNYHEAIYDFLGTDLHPLGSDGIMNPSYAVEDVAERHQFLNQLLHIVYGHWGGYWHIETHPEVTSLQFNPSRTMARVHFRLIYQGGHATFSKIEGKWNMTSSRLSWIE